MYDEYLDFVVQYMGDDDSTFHKLWIATQTMARLLIKDLTTLLGDTKKQFDIYQRGYGDTISLLTHQMDSFSIALKDIEQTMYLSKSSGTVSSRLQDAGRVAETLAGILQETMGLLMLKFKNATMAMESASGRDDGMNDVIYLPRKFFKNEVSCNRTADALSETVASLDDLLTDVRKWKGSKVSSKFRRLCGDLQTHAVEFYAVTTEFSKCLTEYPSLLTEVLSWMQEVEDTVNVTYLNHKLVINDVSFDTVEATKVLNEDLEKATQAKQQYMKNAITKLELISTFHSDKGQSEQVSHISSFTDSLRSKVSNGLISRISEADATFESAYLKAMQTAASLQTYVSAEYYDKASKMQIWKKTEPNLDNPTEFSDASREIWRFWDRVVPIKTFVAAEVDGAKTYIVEGLDSFFKPLLEELDAFEKQLSAKRDDLILVVEEADDEYKEYERTRTIDHQFIL